MTRRLAALRIVAIAAGVIVVVAGAGTVAAVEMVAHQPPPKPSVAQVIAKVRLSLVTIRTTVYRDGVAEGQGFVFGGGGHVLTSAHVVAHATQINVVNAQGVTGPAALVGVDKSLDIAELLTSERKTAPLVAASGPVGVGTQVMALGNNYSALPYTVLRGAVSGTGGQVAVKSQTLGDLIKTDLVVDPANSGGPIVDRSGRVVGMVVPGDAGHAFALPVDRFSSVARSWARSDNVIRLGPPLVTRDAASLVLKVLSLGDVPQIKMEAWAGQGVHVVFERPANHLYGSVGVTIYLFVEPSETAAHGQYSGDVSGSLERFGFTEVGTTTSDLGDEAAALVKVTSREVDYNVIWRDRNVAVDMYLGGGRTLSPDVSMANLIGMATDQEAVIGADLAGW